MMPLAAFLLLFLVVGIGFIFVHLLAGKFIRPSKPDAEKGTIYECGEPTIGSAWIQFDLRFYVVALLFVIFDVEVAFFFPWAEVFGKANAIANANKPETAEEYHDYAAKVLDLTPPPTSSSQHRKDVGRYEAITGRTADGVQAYDEKFNAKKPLTKERLKEMKAEQAAAQEKFARKEHLTVEETRALDMDGPLKKDEFEKNREASGELAWLAFLEVVVFFGVLLVGFAYLWRRGDLAWVRSIEAERPQKIEGPAPPVKRAAEPSQTVAAEHS
jgi:NADH-quinone oxidoreductase subunit A